MENNNGSGKVLTLIGDSIEDCRERLHDMYDSNYDIVDRQTKLEKYGPFGLFQKERVKVWYVTGTRQEKTASDVTDPESLRRVRDEILRKASGGKTSAEIQISEMNNKLDLLSETLKNLPRSSGGEDKIESIERIKELLEDNEFTKDFILNIEKRLKKEFSLDDLKNFSKVEKQVVDWIGESISIAEPKAHRPPHVVVIVGPTGVGKTTTIAKLAAQNKVGKKKSDAPSPNMCMITIDRTRVAAEAQLQVYGDVMDLPVRKAENADDLKAVFDEERENQDIIFIDTSGYSPNDSENIGKMKNTLSVDGLRPDVYLAVTASTKARDLKNIIQNYEPFGFNSMIITKCDETNCYGNVLSVLHEKHKSISYVTDGQQVAHNIRYATVVDFLIRLSGFTIDRNHIEDKFGIK